MSTHHRYAITGANTGLGLESVRQLASLHNGSTTDLYLLCRNEISTNEAIANISNEYEKASFRYIHFDSSDRHSVERAAETLSSAIPDGQVLNGLLLNAGGFTSDRKGDPLKSGATLIAETNLLGHALLLDSLLKKECIAKGSRVVFSGSEAGMGEPSAIQWGGDLQFYIDMLNGTCYKKYSPAEAYGHIKGMIAFYAAAFARKHPEIYTVAVSPGSTRNTSLMDRGQFSTLTEFMIKGFIKLAGQHDSSVGAKRYINALNDEYEYPSGSFVCSRIGYTGEVCNATELKKGKVFGEELNQDLVYEAVRKFVP